MASIGNITRIRQYIRNCTTGELTFTDSYVDNTTGLVIPNTDPSITGATECCAVSLDSFIITGTTALDFSGACYNNFFIDNSKNTCSVLVTLLGDIGGSAQLIIRGGQAKGKVFNKAVITGIQLTVLDGCILSCPIDIEMVLDCLDNPQN